MKDDGPIVSRIQVIKILQEVKYSLMSVVEAEIKLREWCEQYAARCVEHEIKKHDK